MDRSLHPRPPSPTGGAAIAEGEIHRRLAAALVSTSDAGAAVTAVCETVLELTGCDRVQVWRGDIRQMTMQATAAAGYDAIDAERIRTLRIPMNDIPATPDFLERKVLDIDHADELPDPSTRIFADFGIRAATLAVVERADRVLGAIQLSWCGTSTPAFPARSLVDVVRTYAAIAVDMRARTDEALQAADTLSETAMLLARIHDPDELLETMAGRIAGAVGCDLGAVYLVDDDTGLFRFAAGTGPRHALAVMRSLDGAPGDFAQLLAEGDEDVVEFAAIRDHAKLAAHPLASAAASSLNVPLRRGDRLAGVLVLAYTGRTGPFARRQVALAKGLAHHAAVALETARLVRSLEEANRVKSDFVAAVSHDLRTPIHILVGYADMLLDGAAGAMTGEQRDLIDAIRQRSLQFRDLVDGILAVARLDAQRQHSLASPTRLDQLCTSVLRELDDRRAPGVALRYRARPLTVEIDAPKVRMILRNLVSNALKFTTAGEVVLAADVEEAGLRLRVTDTGPGIDVAERAGIFEMFHQGSAARRAGGSGLGLGLYLVRRLAHVLGGHARLLHADPGKTCFEVVLPLRPGTPPAA